jgi:hypothetical protein
MITRELDWQSKDKDLPFPLTLARKLLYYFCMMGAIQTAVQVDRFDFCSFDYFEAFTQYSPPTLLQGRNR